MIPSGGPPTSRASRRPCRHLPTAKIAQPEPGRSIVIRGRVVGPGGRPVKDARVVLSLPQLSASDIRGCRSSPASGADGRFQAVVPRDRIVQLEQLAVGRIEPTLGPILGAVAPGLAIGWIKADLETIEKGPLTITLASDDVPIEGRVTDPEGQPVGGATVRLISVVATRPGFLEKLRASEGRMTRAMRDVVGEGIPLGEQGPIPAVTTDPQGRFRLAGVGRDRLALLFIEGRAIERMEALVFTTSDHSFKPVAQPGDASRTLPVLGPRFELVAAPGRAVEGTVRDAETQRPIAGAKVVLYGIGLTAATDARGKFRISGQPRSQPGMPNLVGVTVDGQPYIKVVQPIDAPKGMETVHAEIALKRGAWVEGRVVDGTTGRPVQAVVEYCPLGDNPHLAEYPGASFLDHNVGDEAEFPTDAEGRFRAVALPGPGVLGVRTADTSYLSAEPPTQDLASRLARFPGFRHSGHFQAVVPIEVRGRDTLAIPEIRVARGHSQKVRILGVDRTPIAGAKVVFLEHHPLESEPIGGVEFAFIHPRPGTAQSAVFFHEEARPGCLRRAHGK